MPEQVVVIKPNLLRALNNLSMLFCINYTDPVFRTQPSAKKKSSENLRAIIDVDTIVIVTSEGVG